MEKHIIISKKELCGRSQKTTRMIENVVKHNTLNKTGRINYNKGGIKDGVGFQPCSDKFVDNFILRVLVADYLIHKKNYVEVGSINRTIRAMLDRNGLKKCKVKAISLKSTSNIPAEMLAKMPFRIHNKECDDTKYCFQDYKIACANVEYGTVLHFLRTQEYVERGLFLKDIDITMDYAGSFDREEVIDYMVTNHDFRCQGAVEDTAKSILDNSDKVGQNCLTYMEKINGMSTRSKIYNKMVQMLECKGVRDTIGCHWKDWVSQQDTRLARARDEARQRGLTRAEVTFYCQNDIPSDKIMEATLRCIVQYVDASLVFTTPYACVWKNYCDSLVHSLVVVDRTQDTALIVYSYNELTQNISGQYISKWSKREMWSLANLTLNGNLPIDLKELLHVSKTGKGNDRLQLSGARYFKVMPDGSNRFTTRLVSHNGVFTSFNGTESSNADLVEKAGLQAHINCSPYLSHVKANLQSKVRAEFKMVQELNIVVPMKQTLQNNDTTLKDAAKQIMEDRRPIELELEEKRKLLKALKMYTEQYSNNKIVPLRDLKQGTYSIMALKKITTRYGDKFIMIIEIDGSLKVCYSNKYLEDRIREHLLDETLTYIKEPQRGFITLYNKPLATLTIKGWGRTEQCHVIVYCSLSWTTTSKNDSLIMQTENALQGIKNKEEKLKELTTSSIEQLPSIPVLVPYKALNNLAELSIGSVHAVSGIGYAKHYGQDKLVVQLDNGMTYQAGEFLEACKDRLLIGCKIIIEKLRLDKARRKSAICKIVQKGDWSGLVDYKRVPLLSSKNKDTKVLDVKTVTHNSQKRKLVLLEDENVYKIKKSKLEDHVSPGLILP